MRKKVLGVLLILLLSVSSVFAFTDSFSYLKDDAAHNNLLTAVKNAEDKDKVEELYNTYLATDPKPVDLARMQYHLVRYAVDVNDKAMAQKHLDYGYSLLPKIEDEMGKALANAEMVSAEYYLTGKTGTGMDSSKLTKELYKKWPEEVAVFLMEANRTLYTPHIAGGSPKRAIEYFHRLENSGIELQAVDQFSLDAGLGVGYSKRNKDAEAKKYLLKAVNIFSGDNSLWKILEKDFGITKDNYNK